MRNLLFPFAFLKMWSKILRLEKKEGCCYMCLLGGVRWTWLWTKYFCSKQRKCLVLNQAIQYKIRDSKCILTRKCNSEFASSECIGNFFATNRNFYLKSRRLVKNCIWTLWRKCATHFLIYFSSNRDCCTLVYSLGLL